MANNQSEKPNSLWQSWLDAKSRGLSQPEHAAEIGMKYTTYASRLHKSRLRAKNGEPEPNNANLFDVDIGKPWVLEGDWCVVGDVHVPTTDYEFAQLPGLMAQRYMRKKPRRLLIAGDFFNMDTFSTYAQVVTPPSWAQERDAGRALLKEWLEVFDEIRMIMGNHDRRLQKFTAGAFETDDILSLLISNPDRVMMSNYGHCTIISGGRKWRVTHPKNYSINQLTVADQMALKYDANIISHHEHHLAKGWDRYKRHVIVNNGGLFNPLALPYVQLDDSKSAGMAKGFTLLIDGTAEVFGEEPYTNWSKWI